MATVSSVMIARASTPTTTRDAMSPSFEHDSDVVTSVHERRGKTGGRQKEGRSREGQIEREKAEYSGTSLIRTPLGQQNVS